MYSKEDTFRKTIKNFIKYALEKEVFKDEPISEEEVKEIVFKGFEDETLDLEIKYTDVKQIREDIIDVIIKEKNSKEKFRLVYSEYIKFMNKTYFYNQHVSKKIKQIPPYYSALERRILIAKKMHSNFNLHKIAREFFVSDRMIQEDLAILKKGDMTFLNRKLEVQYESRYRENVKMKSKAHPLFLVENLTQIIAMLNGLSYVSKESIESGKDSEYKEYAEETAISIWMQLSDDAKSTILDERVDELNLDKEWYNRISETAELEIQNSKPIFKIEEDFSEDIYLDVLKNRKPCTIKYKDDYGKQIKKDFDRIEQIDRYTIEGINLSKENCKINRNKIISIEYKKK
ncbi:MAG: hypothetical protein ACI3VR_10965 [Intestinibacter sp.]|uniref:hypothetical protein n=1 Tax=Intestinibacter sp. TaxID=1965304 RepID=UPI003F144C8E